MLRATQQQPHRDLLGWGWGAQTEGCLRYHNAIPLGLGAWGVREDVGNLSSARPGQGKETLGLRLPCWRWGMKRERRGVRKGPNREGGAGGCGGCAGWQPGPPGPKSLPCRPSACLAAAPELAFHSLPLSPPPCQGQTLLTPPSVPTWHPGLHCPGASASEDPAKLGADQVSLPQALTARGTLAMV